MVDSSLVRHEGNDDLFFALEISVISALAGSPLHFHVEGVRGTGKTTILRSVREHLPPIQRVAGCVYQCRPEQPHCPEHREHPDGLSLEPEERSMPFLEVSHSAKLGTVVGSIDLARLTHRSQPEAALLPGTVPQAHRGILLVDEINRLAETAPDLADVLLSAMGTKPGRIQIEETGLPIVELPVEVSVWAASNPDEEPGPLEDVRRQLADRFDLVIPVRRPHDLESVRRILRRRAALHAHSPLPSSRTLEQLAQQLGQVRLTGEMEELIARIYIDYRLESLRAVEAMAHTARLAALLRGTQEVKVKDLMRVAPLVLRHRVELAVLNQILRDLAARQAAGGKSPPTGPGSEKSDPGSHPEKERTPGGERPSSAEEEVADNSWSKLVSKLRGLLAPQDGQETGASQRSTPQPGTRNGGSVTRQPSSAVTGESRAAAQLADPTTTLVVAPPQPARRLGALITVGELVLRGDLMDG